MAAPANAGGEVADRLSKVEAGRVASASRVSDPLKKSLYRADALLDRSLRCPSAESKKVKSAATSMPVSFSAPYASHSRS